MTRSEFLEWARSRPHLTEDRWGNFKGTLTLADPTAPTGVRPQQYRYHPGKLAVRREVRGHLTGEWLKSRGAYYKDLSITPEGKLKGLKP